MDEVTQATRKYNKTRSKINKKPEIKYKVYFNVLQISIENYANNCILIYTLNKQDRLTRHTFLYFQNQGPVDHFLFIFIILGIYKKC